MRTFFFFPIEKSQGSFPSALYSEFGYLTLIGLSSPTYLAKG